MDIRPDDLNTPENRERVSSYAHQFRDRANEFAEKNKDKAALEADRIADALGEAANRLNSQNDPFGSLLASAADRIHDASHYLREHNSDSLMHTVRDFSKSNPYLSAGGMFAAGFALSRFLHSGQSDDMQETGGQI